MIREIFPEFTKVRMVSVYLVEYREAEWTEVVGIYDSHELAKRDVEKALDGAEYEQLTILDGEHFMVRDPYYGYSIKKMKLNEFKECVDSDSDESPSGD